jgi:succinate dehydrogenase/fumarate reductase cytochrome b subunit
VGVDLSPDQRPGHSVVSDDPYRGYLDDLFLSPAYEEALKLYKSVAFGIGEIFLAAALLYHAFNGLRVALIDFKPELTQHQRKLWVGVWALFVVTFLPAAFIMGRSVLRSMGIQF